MAYDELVAKVTLVGSFVSCVASAVMLAVCLVLPRRWSAFPHALILNLALAGTYVTMMHVESKGVSLDSSSEAHTKIIRRQLARYWTDTSWQSSLIP